MLQPFISLRITAQRKLKRRIYNIAHETAICPNKPVNNCIGNRKKKLPILKRPKLKHVSYFFFSKKIRTSNLFIYFFFEDNILTEGVFIIALSSNAGISFWRIAWVTTNFCFMRGMFLYARMRSVWQMLYASNSGEAREGCHCCCSKSN